MTKTNLTMGLLLACCCLVACGGGSHATTGTAGNPGSGGGTGAAGQPGDASVADRAIRPDDAGHCPMQGAYPHGGLCVCQADTPDVCDSVCLDLKSDNDHCGDCATKCPATSVCNAGKCSAPPTVVLPAPTASTSADGGAASCGPLRLVATGGTLYWTDTLAGTVNAMQATGGGTPTVLVSGQMAPTHLQLVGGSVFWLNSGEKKIMKSTLKSALSAGAPAPVFAAPDTDSAIGGFAVSADGATVYFSSIKADATVHPRATINKIAATGGAVTVLGAQDHGFPAAVAIDGNTVAFPVNGNGDVNAILAMDGKVAQCGLPPADGGMEEIDVNCSRLGRSQGELFIDDIFAFGGSVYWLNGQQLETGVVVNNPGSFDVIAAAPNSNSFTAFTMDGTTTAYMVENGAQVCATWKDPDAMTECLVYGPAAPAFVEKAPLMKAATVVPLARIGHPKDVTQVMAATSIAVDGNNVYYATDDCAIMTAAK
jgi:hypothetical protein